MPRGFFILKHALASAVMAAAALVSADETLQPAAITTDSQDPPLEEVIISVPEPRWVSPTRRDQIGRIWAPVYINDKGPFRMVLDTGASHSGVVSSVAGALMIEPDHSNSVMLRGVTGSAVVPSIRVNSLRVGELMLTGKKLPIIIDALGGAQGILGTEGLTDKRVFIDFRNDLIVINKSHNERAATGYITIPIKFDHGRLLTTEARVGNVRAVAIIDTGGQATIGNRALREALFRNSRRKATIDSITGATDDVQVGEGYPAPPILIRDMQILSSHITFGDMQIFEHWKLTSEPAILLGMDVLGLVDTLIIDYKRAELQVRMRSSAPSCCASHGLD